MAMAQVSFWLAAGFLAYTYIGYPLMLWVWGTVAHHLPRRRPIQPRLSVLVVAHNEERRIEERIENLLASDYPPGRLDIIVASDGSTDRTVERARRYLPPRVRVVDFAERRGKSAVLNDLIPRARGGIVVLADARQRFEPGALKALAAPFADPRVGAVGGELLLLDAAQSSGTARGVDFYWRYEKFIRRAESRVGSTVGASGAIYALRRRLFRPVDDDIILDDVLIPMNVVRQGYRVVFEPRAQAFDRATVSAAAEFGRKARTIAGNFQLFRREAWLLNPFANRLWLQTVSHKFCRLLGPLCLAVAFGSNLALVGDPLYRTFFVMQLLFYGAAALGRAAQMRGSRLPLLHVPCAFCLLNWATVVALVRLLNGRQHVTWERFAG